MDQLSHSAERAEELGGRYADWVSQSASNLAIGCIIMIALLVGVILFVSKVVLPLYRILTFKKVRVKMRRRRNFIASLQPGRLNAMTAPHLLQEAVTMWGGKPVSSDATGDRGGEDVDGNPVDYPSVFYIIRSPKGVTGSVKNLFKTVADHEPGWCMRPSRKGGRTEFFNSRIGYRV